MWNEILFCVWWKNIYNLLFIYDIGSIYHTCTLQCIVWFFSIYLFILEKLQMNASWSLWRELGIPTARKSVLFSCVPQRDLLDMSQHTSGRSPFPPVMRSRLPVYFITWSDVLVRLCLVPLVGCWSSKVPADCHRAHLVTLHTPQGNKPELSGHWTVTTGMGSSTQERMRNWPDNGNFKLF